MREDGSICAHLLVHYQMIIVTHWLFSPKRICTTHVDPEGLAPLLTCRLVALDKCPGITGTLQLCARQEDGSEAAVQTMCKIHSDSDAVILVDAFN